MESSKIIFPVLLLIFSYFFSKYILVIFKKIKLNQLIDNQFEKPQAFHENSTYRIGGLIIFVLLVISFIYLFLSENIFYPEYVSFCILFFLLGLVDDLKINIKPNIRLLLMFIFLITLIISNNFYIEKTGLEFLNNLLQIKFWSISFIVLCFLFTINGSNLIDGFNGLLGIHALIIFTVLFIINLTNNNSDFAYTLFYFGLLTLIFLKFNFPKAQIFLGDSGAYLVGTLIAISAIKTSILNPYISPFFFCILLFYIFFEVFFSFFRKLLVTKKNPLLPDNKHLHMLIYNILLKKSKIKLNSNYMSSIYINLIYLLLIIPGIFFMDDGVFCRYYFLLLLVIYIYLYRMFLKKIF